MVGIVVFRAMLAGTSYEVINNYLTSKNLIKMEFVAEDTGLTFKDLQKSLNSLTEIIFDHHLALDFLLAEQGWLCAVANTSCCRDDRKGQTKYFDKQNGLRNSPRYGIRSRHGCHVLPGFSLFWGRY
jgi:hypothetical protein